MELIHLEIIHQHKFQHISLTESELHSRQQLQAVVSVAEGNVEPWPLPCHRLQGGHCRWSRHTACELLQPTPAGRNSWEQLLSCVVCFACRGSCVVCRVSSAVCRLSCAVRRVSRVVCRVLCVVCNIPCSEANLPHTSTRELPATCGVPRLEKWGVPPVYLRWRSVPHLPYSFSRELRHKPRFCLISWS